MATETARALGRRLAAARQEKGWRKSDTARELGIKLPTYLRYEDGDRWPSVDLLLRAADVFDKRVAWFFEEAEIVQVSLGDLAIDPALRRALIETPRERQALFAEVLPAINAACDRRTNHENAH